jgi:CheY-like chemotaxis protein
LVFRTRYFRVISPFGEGRSLARKILLADDSVTAQNMGRKILADAGYEVLTVNNGSAALKRVTESKPDLIVLDVYMPGYSGLEVCQRLKESPETAHIPILLTVGKLEPFKPDEARRARADAHIVKPFEASELLTVLARLEDRMVPHADGPRFSTTVSGVERFGSDRESKGVAGADGESGWKSRLRFPSKKKKEEAEAEPDDLANFRDYKKGKGKKAGAGGDFPASPASPAPQPGQEPGLVPDIPRDITPEELDALSALAAKLDSSIPAAESVASLADKIGPAAEVKTTLDPKPETMVPVEATPAPPPREFEVPAPVIEATVPHSEGANEIEIPVAQVEPSVVAAEVVQGQPRSEKTLAQATQAEMPTEVGQVTPSPEVGVASFAEETAPIDREDEPRFLSSQGEKPQANLASVEVSAVTSEASALSPAVRAEVGVEQRDNTQTESSQPVSATESLTAEPQSMQETKREETEEAKAPSEQELAEALRLLTPSIGSVDTLIPSQGTLVAAGQMLAEEAVRNASAGARWVAQAVEVSPEETKISLEEEMFRTFAAATTAAEIQSAITTGKTSMIAEAIESRLTASGAASNPATSESPASHETVHVVAPAEALPATKEEADQEPPATTFAAAVAYQESESIADPQTTVDSSQPAPAVASDQNPSSELGDQQAMAKDGKGNGKGKSGWHQIHGAAAANDSQSDAVEAAKAANTVESPKAMAAAAAAAESSKSATDPAAIANIVDSVLADLRPKIVEEIAKKLAGK